MIYSKDMLKKMKFIVFKQMDVGYSWDLPVGTSIEVKNFDGKDIKFRIVKNDANLQVCAAACLKSNLDSDREDLIHLKKGLELWNKEPDKFEYIEKHGYGNHWWHKEGKKCEYSYLDTLGYFMSKKEFENTIKEKEVDIERMSTGKEDKYYYDLVAKNDYEVSVEEFNECISNC
jgi:hypothetical protein